MEIDSDFTLPLAPDAAYALLLDLDRVAPCLPGASLGAQRPDGARELSLTVRLGPMKFVYDGSIAVTERDPAQRRGVLTGRAEERRGQGSAGATITMSVVGDDAGGARVTARCDVELTGRAAQTGRAIVADVAKRMVDDMAACLTAQAAAELELAPVPAPAPAAAPVRAERLLAGLVRERLRGLWRRVVERLRRRR